MNESKKLTADDIVKKTHVVDVVRHGNAFVVPDGMSIDDGIAALERLKRLEEEVYSFMHTFEAFVWDGAVALDAAIKNIFGYGFGESTFSFFGTKPPEMIEVATGPKPTDRTLVPWGKMSLPNIDGVIITSGGVENGKFVFKLIAQVKRKHEKQIQALADEVRKQLSLGSIYRGKAIKLSFASDRVDPWTGETIPNTPEFLNLGNIDESQLIFSRDVQDAVATNLFTPIDRLDDLRAMGMSGKRGVLLAGTYGVGKTLAASVTASKAQSQGVTFLLCEKAEEFAQAVQFAKMYAPAVVFCEDIDRALQGERSVKMDVILNTVDGIESKSTEVMVVLTTNDVESINPAALRPGRFDAVINITPPDAEATARLIRLYAKGAIPEHTDISDAAKELAGNIPAVIAEAVKRAKLSQVRLNEPGTRTVEISPEAMLDSAKSMKMQLDLLNRERKVDPSNLEKAANIIGRYLESGITSGGSYASANLGAEAFAAVAKPNGRA